MFAATVCYRSGLPFDLDYYLGRHVPMSEELMVPLGMVRAEVRSFAPAPDGTMPPYQIMTTVYFESAEAFQAFATSPIMAQLQADVPNFHPGQPDLFAGEVLLSSDYTAQMKP